LAWFSGTKRAMTTPRRVMLISSPASSHFNKLGVTIAQFANRGGFHVAPKF
jgi:hypothetical protein